MSCEETAFVRIVDTFSRYVEKIVRLIGCFFLAAVSLLVFEEVISRYFLGLSHSFVFEWTQWGLAWVSWLYVVVILLHDKHIRVDFLFRIMPKKLQAVSLAFTTICNLAFFLSLLYCGISLTRTLIMAQSTSSTEIPTPLWIPYLIVPVSGLLLVIFTFAQLIRIFIPSRRAPQEESAGKES